MLPSHTTVTPNGAYRYRRRTPIELKEYIEVKEITRSLGSNPSEAIVKSMELSGAIDQAILLSNMPSIHSSVLQALLEKQHLTSINDDLSSTKSTKLSAISHLFTQQSQVGHIEQASQHYLYKSLLPALLQILFKEPNPDINFLTYPRLLKIRSLLAKIPNRKYGDYKSLALLELVQGVHTGTIVTPSEHLNKSESINAHLKRVKALIIFAQQLGHYKEVVPKSITLQNTESNDRDYKAILGPQELTKVFSSVPDDNLSYIYKVLYMSGMRRSELYKCKVSDVEGVLCFDLRTPKINLKTKTSHRVIPVHPQLMDKVNQFESIISSYLPGHLSKVFKRVTGKELSDTDRKTLYSLRHTFATNLIAKGIPAEIVSELMGHQHATMTLNRYVKGYPVLALKSAIDTL